MVFRNFDKLLFAAEEITTGTAATITTANDFFEVIEPTYTITPLMFERPMKAQSLTKQVQTVPGTGKGGATQPVATVEFSFGVELTGVSAVSTGTAPKIERFLKACGMKKTNVYKYGVTGTTYSGGPFYHYEGIEGTSGSYSSADATAWSCNAYGDAEFLASGTSALGTTAIKSQHSGATVTATGTAASQVGVGYSFDTAFSDNEARSSVTIRLYIGGGTYVEAAGCKGTFEIAFVHGDRAVINFTMTGFLNEVADGALPTDHTYTANVPPAWINTGMSIGDDTANTALYTGALFNSMTLTCGNEVTVREDTNSANGFQHAIIADRNPTLTWNPDAVTAATRDYFDSFLAGTPQRMRWSCGSATDNRVDFRVTSAQFTGVADGDRDSVVIYDTTTQLTGGAFGSSLITGQGTPSASSMGSENELFILFR